MRSDMCGTVSATSSSKGIYEAVPKIGMVLTRVSKDSDFCIKPRQYQMGQTPSTGGP